MSANLPKKILVVDDSKVQRDFAVELCHKLGIAWVLEAEDGLDAMAQLKRSPDIDAMILDLEMPNMDGVEVLHELVKFKFDPAIIVASARENVLLNVVENLGKQLGLHLLGVLQKPLTPGLLANSLSRYGAVRRGANTAQNHSHTEVELSEKDIERALKQHEFISYFQPKISLVDNQLVGVEALIRWQHPTYGLLFPKDFIALIEDSSYISEVTLEMLRLSLHALKAWQAQGLVLSCSVNLSAHSLSQADFADKLIALVAVSGIEPAQLIFEITESALMTDLRAAQGALARVRLKQFGLSIDDYGTGFSCMLQLARVPCSELKIDRAFVDGASHSAQLRILLESALDIARKLELKVVAEGVERLEDWQLLQTLKCDMVQGFFIAKPMPFEMLLPWWRSNQTRIRAL